MSGRRLLDSLDLPILLTVAALLLAGLLAIASATMDDVEQSGLWRMQLLWLIVATVAAVVVVFVDYRVWAEIALVLHGG